MYSSHDSKQIKNILHGGLSLQVLAKQQSILNWVTIYVTEDSKKYC